MVVPKVTYLPQDILDKWDPLSPFLFIADMACSARKFQTAESKRWLTA